MRTSLAPERIARFLGNRDRFLEQWNLEPESIGGLLDVPQPNIIRGWLADGKRPSERSVRAIAGVFGITDHRQMLDRDYSYIECEKLRQAVENEANAEKDDENSPSPSVEQSATMKSGDFSELVRMLEIALRGPRSAFAKEPIWMTYAAAINSESSTKTLVKPKPAQVPKVSLTNDATAEPV